jgi:hypothetical protein
MFFLKHINLRFGFEDLVATTTLMVQIDFQSNEWFKLYIFLIFLFHIKYDDISDFCPFLHLCKNVSTEPFYMVGNLCIIRRITYVLGVDNF